VIARRRPFSRGYKTFELSLKGSHGFKDLAHAIPTTFAPHRPDVEA